MALAAVSSRLPSGTTPVPGVPQVSRESVQDCLAAAQDGLARAARHPMTAGAVNRFINLPNNGKLVAAVVAAVFLTCVLKALFAAFFALASSMCLVFAGAYLSAKRPPASSFEPAFYRWFTEDYYPQVSVRLQRTSTVQQKLTQWLTRQLGSLEAPAAYAFWATRCLPAQMTDCLVVRVARVNMGTKESSAPVTFIGVHGCWMLMPRVAIDFNNLSLLEEASAPISRSA
mmetsp:Transcript_34337/g.77600  ORF Transcript_34337/g.77600 Transcript_34337/m.77600 type:complete len:229 (+) Transcript_34337:53-739(+)|eukprot:CAMPEP_0197891582 /NCGR_PEP_ID=MMETSP1439-20131203/28987_1 /TAXON_ID=66791 /ORGANISM="Gonyaulax spinifera, Strain CCMP409" /LENGTH=228 /DNA_ID=CAMNT_0043511691 /DNA_START=43 /DNA_END=729 /DNA_ORIENTATION=+